MSLSPVEASVLCNAGSYRCLFSSSDVHRAEDLSLDLGVCITQYLVALEGCWAFGWVGGSPVGS